MSRTLLGDISRRNRALGLVVALLAISLFTAEFSTPAKAQDQDQDDPPGRVARLSYMEGSVSFQPAGENEWVEAVPNRPMTTGDKLWADRDSRAEVQLGSARIILAANTGFSFLNLDDRTVQIELSSGTIDVRVYSLDRDNVFEIDTANQAFSVYQPGRYRLEASEDGSHTVVTIREGEGESTGNGQSYTLHAGQRTTFSGTNSLNAEVEQIGGRDDFDDWSERRERRYQDSPSARYCSRRVVGFEDLDDNGDWQSTPNYGYVWFPRVSVGWAPYRDGHWAWIDPWGWTWVDDARWGYAPFHYGRWASYRGRWGWIPGPIQERPVYAPALVAFVGGSFAVGATVAWFPLGPREVYVPSYRVSERYVNRVNITNTNVNTTIVHNVYNTTIVNNNTTINNVTYVNRNVHGGVTAMPQHAFASAQPVQRSAVAVNQQQFARGPVVSRAAVPPAREAVLGARANTANRVAAPPPAVVRRPVVAKAAPPPPPPSFAARQQVLTQHPGQSVGRQEMQRMRPAASAAAPPPRVIQAPPGKPATATPGMNRPGNQPGNSAARPGGNPPPANQPGNPGENARPGENQPNNRPQPNQPQPNQPNNRPEPNRPNEPPARNERPASAQPNDRPQPNQPQPNQPNNRPEPNRPNESPTPNDRPPSAQPNNRPEPNQPNRPEPNRPEPNRNEPPARNDRPPSAQPNNRPEPNQPNRPEPNRPEPNRNEPPARNERPPSAQPNRPDPNQPRANQPMPDSRPNPEQPNANRPQNRPEPPSRNERAPEAQPNRPSEQPRNARPEPAQPRPQPAPPAERQQSRPPEARPAPQPRPQPQTPEEKKRQDQQNKHDQKPQ